jgi:hypothetical protein
MSIMIDEKIEILYERVLILESFLLGQSCNNDEQNKRLRDMRISFQSIKDELLVLDNFQMQYIGASNDTDKKDNNSKS